MPATSDVVAVSSELQCNRPGEGYQQQRPNHCRSAAYAIAAPDQGSAPMFAKEQRSGTRSVVQRDRLDPPISGPTEKMHGPTENEAIV
jgi:hypothetical protein